MKINLMSRTTYHLLLHNSNGNSVTIFFQVGTRGMHRFYVFVEELKQQRYIQEVKYIECNIPISENI